MGLVEKFAVVEMGGTAGRGKRMHAREQSVHAYSMDRIAKSKPLLTRKILRLCTLLC